MHSLSSRTSTGPMSTGLMPTAISSRATTPSARQVGAVRLQTNRPASTSQVRNRLVLASGVALAVGAGLLPSGAQAQLLNQFIAPDVPGTGVQRDVTVLSRQRPDYDPLGIRLGDTMIRPMLNESFGYDDNVTGLSHGTGSPLIETNAIIGANFDHSVYTANAQLTVDDMEYPSQSQYSYTNWTASAGGNYEFDRDLLSFSLSHQNLNQTAADLDVPRLSRSLAYRVDTMHVGYRADFDRFYLLPAVDVSYFNYDNGTVGGVIYQQSYRDRVAVTPSLTGGYTFGRLTVVGVVRDAVADFTGPRDGLPTQNYNDVSALGGLDYDATGFLRYRLLAGYEVRTFNAGAYKTIAQPIVEGTVIWSPTGLTTVTGQVSRRIQDSSAVTTVALTESAAAVTVDHELLRNVLLRGTGAYYIDQYGEGGGTQQLYSVGGGVTYLLNRNVQVSGAYTYTARRSPTSTSLAASQVVYIAPSYNDNRFVLTLRLAL